MQRDNCDKLRRCCKYCNVIFQIGLVLLCVLCHVNGGVFHLPSWLFLAHFILNVFIMEFGPMISLGLAGSCHLRPDLVGRGLWVMCYKILGVICYKRLNRKAVVEGAKCRVVVRTQARQNRYISSSKGFGGKNQATRKSATHATKHV